MLFRSGGAGIHEGGAPQIWLWVVMGLLIDFGRRFGAEFRWWIVVAMGVVVWWWPGVGVDRR